MLPGVLMIGLDRMKFRITFPDLSEASRATEWRNVLLIAVHAGDYGSINEKGISNLAKGVLNCAAFFCARPRRVSYRANYQVPTGRSLTWSPH